ncbi:MAG: rhodanese-like domain-containing protein [Verrucomicrobiota bacterium]
MDGLWWIFPIAVAVVFGLKRLTFVSAAKARQLLRDNARVIDVRSRDEFRRGAVPGAVNIPLDSIREDLPRLVPDRNEVLLLHCLSGTRSALARRQAIGLGYRNVHNLGSFGRARKLAATR